jgi:hypothetical protein
VPPSTTIRALEHPRFSDDAWHGLPPVDKQRMLSALVQQMGQFVSASAAAGGFDRPDSHMTRTSLRLDQQGWKELAEATRKWLSEAERIGEAAAERLEGDAAREGDGDGPTRSLDAGLVVMLFEARPFSEHPPEPASRGGAPRRRSAPGARSA